MAISIFISAVVTVIGSPAVLIVAPAALQVLEASIIGVSALAATEFGR
ncbi:hypothetical protein [Cohnella rhizosphaerae]